MSNYIDRQRVEQFAHLELLARQAVEGFITGLHKSPFHGFSVEFAEHRQYNTGESTRHIDWKLYGRTEKLFVKRYEEETNLRCRIIIDNSSSMYFPEFENDGEKYNKITFSVYAAAALIELLRRQRDAVGLSMFSEDVELHTPSKSSIVHHKFLYNELEKLLGNRKPEQQQKTFAIDALHQLAENTKRRSLIAIFSDMFDSSEKNDELFSALQHLRHNKHEVMLFHVVEKDKELDFDYDNRPHTFVDMETGERVKLNPAQVKENYLKSVNEFTQELKLRCAQYHIDYLQADIAAGFDQVLLQYLIKRSRLH